MDGAVYKSLVLALCLVVSSLTACSSKEAPQPNQVDRSQRDAPVAVAEGGKTLGSGGTERPVAGSRKHVSIKRAMLSSAGEEDLIHVWVGYRGSEIWPRCSLLEGEAVDKVRRTIRRNPPSAEGWTKSLWVESLWSDQQSHWANPLATEKLIEDDGTVLWIFQEDSARPAGTDNPERTPFYVRCAGGEQSEIVDDVAHVPGTPTMSSRDAR